MKKFVSVLLAVVTLVNLLFACNVFAAEDYVKQNGLSNTLYKIKNDNKLNIAYFGGSITFGLGSTDGGSYAMKTYEFLKNTYGADKEFNYINKAVSGTGTVYGTYRMDDDLSLNDPDKVPDLTFIEFAINDSYDGISYDESATYMESIVRRLYAANPYMDIVIIFTTDINTFDYKNNQPWSEWKNLQAHKEVAEKYRIPTLYVGKALNEKIYKECGNTTPPEREKNTVWLKYFTDVVHPTNEGYKVYTEVINEYLKSELDLNKTVENQQKIVLGKSFFNSHDSAYLVKPSAYCNAGNQWKKDGSGYVYSDGANQTLHFKFTGTGLSIRSLEGMGKTDGYRGRTVPFGNLTYYIDNTKYTKNILSSNHFLTLAYGLDGGEHDVVIMTDENTIPEGFRLSITQLGIIGDGEKRGIQTDLDSDIKFLTNPLKIVKDVDFAEEIEGYEGASWCNNGSNWLDETGYKNEENGVNYKPSASQYRRPMFIQYNLSELQGKEIAGAMLFGKVSSPNSFCIEGYDVPGDDLNYQNNGVIERIPVNTDSNIFKVWKNNSEGNSLNIADYVSSDIKDIDVSRYNMGVDITEYIRAQMKDSKATFMIRHGWNGCFTFENPILVLKVADISNTDTVSLTCNKDVVNDGDCVTVTASSVNGIADVAFYIDGKEYTGDVLRENGKFSVTVSNLGYGEHKISAKAISIYGILLPEKSITVNSVSSKFVSVPSVIVNTFYGEPEGTATNKNHLKSISIGSEWSQGIANRNWEYKKQISDFSQTEPEYALYAKLPLPKLTEGINIRSAKILVNIPQEWSDITQNKCYLYELEDGISPDINWWTGNALKLSDGDTVSDTNYSYSGYLKTDNENYTSDKTALPDSYNSYLDVTDYVSSLCGSNKEYFNFKWTTQKDSLLTFCKDTAQTEMTNPAVMYIELGLPISAEITSNTSLKYEKPFKLSVNAQNAENASVSFKIDGEDFGSVSQKDERGEYTLFVDNNNLSEGRHTVEFTVTDLNGSTYTGTETIYLNNAYMWIPISGSAYKKVTDDFEYDTAGVWGVKEGQYIPLAVSKSGGSLVKSTFGYYQFDVKNIDTSNIDKVYLAYATSSQGTRGALDYNKIDIERVSAFTDDNIKTKTPDVLESIVSNYAMSNAKTETTDEDYPILSQNIVAAVPGDVFNKIDITESFKNIDENFAVCVSRSLLSGAGIQELRSTCYLYVIYKNDTITDNTERYTVNVRPSQYVAYNEKITVLAVNYNNDGAVLNIVKKEYDTSLPFESFDVEKGNAAYSKVFIWNNGNSFLNVLPLYYKSSAV
ncbi:MAG: SGNH/GDSL hydrolase family protein [Clostridia bacterium]|nr:SGNH/GDSL hydrolase family protein [Clostridia bacterium]